MKIIVSDVKVSNVKKKVWNIYSLRIVVLRKMITKVNGINAHSSNTITLFTNFLRTAVEITTSLMAYTRDFEEI